jgi:hypothetical protein
MEKPRRRAKFLCAIAVVLGLHVTVIWLLLATSRVLSFRTKSQSVEIVLIARPVVAPEHNSISRVLENATDLIGLKESPRGACSYISTITVS